MTEPVDEATTGRAGSAALRSTSMPTDPLTEVVAPTTDPLDTQLLDLFFDRVPMGVAVFGPDMRLQRCNKTWTAFYEHYLGVGADYTRPGRHLNELIPGTQETVQELVDHALAGRMVRQAAHRVAIPGTETYWDVVFAPLFSDGRVAGVVDIVTDATDRVLSFQRLEARIAMFSKVAAGMSVDQPLPTTLSQVVHAVRQTTAALACSIVCWEEDYSRPATAYADEVLGDGFAAALEELWRVRGMRPVAASDYDLVVHRGFRDEALAEPALAPIHGFLRTDVPWQDMALIPLVASGAVLGEVGIYLAAGQELTDDDIGYLNALADQAAVAVRNSTLFHAAEQNATLVERHRLARDLHDSVSQALFSMTLHARTAQRHLAAAGLPAEHPVSVEVDQLHALTQAALAEMRALIFELRPGALEAEGLASALGKQAAALAAREQLPVEVHAPAERLSIPPKVEEHVYRLVLEALHNAVRHAEAHRLDVWLATLPDGGLEVRVVDDGVGFDPAVPHPGHLGLHTMRDRAEAVRGVLDVVSRPGHGTEVRLTVPLHH